MPVQLLLRQGELPSLDPVPGDGVGLEKPQEGQGRVTDRIGGEDEDSARTQELDRCIDQGRQALFEPPDLPSRPPAVVCGGSRNTASYERPRRTSRWANRRASSQRTRIPSVPETGPSQVLGGPVERLLGGVDVRDAPAGRHGEHAGGARVAEQIEERGPWLGALRKQAPVRGLLGEEAHVLEGRGADQEPGRPYGHLPLLGRTLTGHPTPTAIRLALESEVRTVPQGRLPACPEGLGIGPVEHDGTEALQLAPVPTVEEGVLCERAWREDAGRVTSSW